MESLIVVETHVSLDSCLQFGKCPVVVEVDVLVLQRPPESLDVDIVQGTIDAVHADPYAIAIERGGESLRGELATLIRVEDRRHSVDRYGFFEGRDAELSIERIGNLPRQNLPRVDIDDRHQVYVSSCNLDVRDVSSPYLIGQPYVLAPQKVRILPVVLRWHARPLARVNGPQTCPFHDAADLFARNTHVGQLPRYLAVAVEGSDPKYFKNGLQYRDFPFVVGLPWLVVVGGPADAQDLALLRDGEPGIVRLYNFGSLPYSCLYFFFR